VNPKIGLTFASILRTALRHDPDIVLVGEMRDRETVEMGLGAAMTGHLVFSTLHTMNAVSTVSRLLDMGAQGYLIAAALDGVLAQRLVRRICENCSHPAELAVHQRAWLAQFMTPEHIARTQFAEGIGCTYCNMTGYRGRIGVYELLEIDAPLADAIRRTDLSEFARLAASAPNFIPLVQRALQFAIDKVTSVDELMRSLSGLEETERHSSLLEDVLAVGDDLAPAVDAAALGRS
jgi:MSHA biogenesis protein MshE